MMTVKTVAYEAPDGRKLEADLYLPAGEGPFPALVAAPGGGWLRGHRSQLAHWGTYLAENGFAFFSVDYRRSDKGACFPHNVEDVRAGYHYLYDNAIELGVKPERIGLLGASAGANLISLMAMTEERLAPSVMVLAYGVYDLFAHWQADRWRNTKPGSDLTEKMLGCQPYDDPALYFNASPLRKITFDKAKNKKVLMTWGDADTAVLPCQSEGFSSALEQAGAVVKNEVVRGAGHFWFSSDPISDASGFTAGLAPKLVRFLEQFLKE